MLETFRTYVRNIPQSRVRVLLTEVKTLFGKQFLNLYNSINFILKI